MHYSHILNWRKLPSFYRKSINDGVNSMDIWGRRWKQMWEKREIELKAGPTVIYTSSTSFWNPTNTFSSY